MQLCCSCSHILFSVVCSVVRNLNEYHHISNPMDVSSSLQMTLFWWLSPWRRLSFKRLPRCPRTSWSCPPLSHAPNRARWAKAAETQVSSRDSWRVWVCREGHCVWRNLSLVWSLICSSVQVNFFSSYSKHRSPLLFIRITALLFLCNQFPVAWLRPTRSRPSLRSLSQCTRPRRLTPQTRSSQSPHRLCWLRVCPPHPTVTPPCWPSHLLSPPPR